MLKHIEGARLGIFVFLGTVLIVLSIFLIGSKEALFVSSITVKSTFERVEGLKTGAPVRLSGYTIGSVSNIELGDVIHFIRLDSEASIETEGLVGKKVISITAGSTELEIISENGFIQSKAPVNISEIIEETQQIMAYVKFITKDFSEIVAKINEGEGTIGRIINDDALYESTVQVSKTADTSLTLITQRMDEVATFLVDIGSGASEVFNNVDTAITGLKQIVQGLQQGEGMAGALLTDKSGYDSLQIVINNLVGTTEAAMVGTRAFAENMEALKHNWLFKGYFEERGYWTKEEYEAELDKKIAELTRQNEELEKKLSELRELGVEVDNLNNN
jgi:phospholipid/cholesterol/gamma-HCH transport system substrate-binding protein